MSTNSTQPEEKGFFEKVKETIESLWEGTKDTAEDVKEAAEAVRLVTQTEES